jgi:hypothetical protein
MLDINASERPEMPTWSLEFKLLIILDYLFKAGTGFLSI